MTTRELVRDFVRGATGGSASSGRLRIEEGNVLVNYSTPIAIRIGNKVVLNSSKYSVTTSKHQNRVRDYADSRRLIEVSSTEFEEIYPGGKSINEVLEGSERNNG